jgi:hypothetical protein
MIADWRLIHHSEADITRIVAGAGFHLQGLSIQKGCDRSDVPDRD